MTGTHSEAGNSIGQLIFVPALITLAVTLLRLAGELQHGPKTLFNPAAGGPWSIVGITWLPFVFGIFFAAKLARRGEFPPSIVRGLVISVLGFLLLFAGQMVAHWFFVHVGFKATLLAIWTMWTVAGLLQLAAWPSLFRVLVAYAYAARVPVTLIMFLAFRGRWGTHYDALPPGWQSAGLWPDFIWLGFIPQLTLWVGFTLVAGMLFAAITAAMARLFRPAAAAPA